MDLDFEYTQQKEQERRQQDFLILSMQLQSTLRSIGIQIVPFRDPALIHFSKMQPVLQEKLLESLAIETEIIMAIDRSGQNPIRSDKRLTLDFLKRTGLEAPADMLLYLEDGDFVSIYNREQQMIFLSPNHLTWMSYSLEDLFCRPWFDLFRRSDSIEKSLRERATLIVSGQKQDCVPNFDIPQHIVTEIESPDQLEVFCRSKLYAPLFRMGKLAGLLSLNNGTGLRG